MCMHHNFKKNKKKHGHCVLLTASATYCVVETYFLTISTKNAQGLCLVLPHIE